MERRQLSFFEEMQRDKKKVTLSLDKLYLSAVFFIIIFVVSFSLGVEKGKRINLANLKTQPIESKKVMQKEPLPASIEKSKDEVERETITETPTQPEVIYAIQLASYSRKDIAEEEAKKLGKKGFKPFLIQKGKYLVLYVGKFKTKKEARSVAHSLKSRYSDCLIRKL